MHKAGFPNTLALMHGDISDIQKKVLEWYQVPIYVMMDNDKTGEGDKIRDRIIKKIKGDFKVKTCKLPDYKDPNESSEEEIKYAILNAK
jgi:DNA primase